MVPEEGKKIKKFLRHGHLGATGVGSKINKKIEFNIFIDVRRWKNTKNRNEKNRKVQHNLGFQGQCCLTIRSPHWLRRSFFFWGSSCKFFGL